MKKTNWKYLVDVLMFLAMIGIILIGLLLAFVLKEGPAIKESDKFFLGLHRHQWTHIHLYLSLAFTAALVFHLILEWSWIKGKSQKLFKAAWRPALGLIVTGAVLLPFAFWAFLPKNAPEYYEFGFGRGQGRIQATLVEREHETKLVSGRLETDQADFVVTGRMTLRQVEAKTGIPAGRILAQMGLPGHLSRAEALGRLRRRYGFTLVEFRTAVEALMEKK